MNQEKKINPQQFDWAVLEFTPFCTRQVQGVPHLRSFGLPM